MKALYLVALTTILTACFDSSTITGSPDSTHTGNGSDNAENDKTISGQWTGEWTNSSTLLESCGTASTPFVLDINQTGTSVNATATLDCIGTPIENVLSGTLFGSEIILTDANNRDTFSLLVQSASSISGTVVDTTETISADIIITR